jgi:hypothetical protein
LKRTNADEDKTLKRKKFDRNNVEWKNAIGTKHPK